jgi:hypothetical protein
MAWKILTEVSNFRNLSLDHATGVEESVSQSVIATRTNERRRKTQTPLYLIKIKIALISLAILVHSGYKRFFFDFSLVKLKFP